MKSNRVVGFILGSLVVIASAFAFLTLAFKLLGIDTDNLNFSYDSKFDFVTFAMSLLGLIIFTVLFNVLAFLFADRVKGYVYRVFDRNLLPKENSADIHKTRPGERLEKVDPQSFWLTTAWELITQTIFPLFTLSMFIGLIAAFVASLKDWSVLFLGAFVIGSINMLVLPFAYWIKEWRRLNVKFTIFTFVVYYPKVRMPILSLLFGIGTLPKVSPTPISEILEVQISADPQDFDPEYKTSWLQDQYISIIARRTNVRTLFIRSRSEKAEDIIYWLDNGPGIKNILDNLVQFSSEYTLEQSFIANEALRIKMSENQAENLSGVETSQLKKSLSNRFKKIPEGSKVYDLYRVTDPGLYDSAGNLIAQENGDEQVKPTVNVLPNISGHRSTR